MLQQYSRVNVTLLFNGIQNITQFRTGTAVFGVYDCILDGAEIEQSTSVRGEIFAGADDFSFSSDLEGPEIVFCAGIPTMLIWCWQYAH